VAKVQEGLKYAWEKGVREWKGKGGWRAKEEKEEEGKDRKSVKHI
jgi:hypothetical protein